MRKMSMAMVLAKIHKTRTSVAIVIVVWFGWLLPMLELAVLVVVVSGKLTNVGIDSDDLTLFACSCIWRQFPGSQEETFEDE